MAGAAFSVTDLFPREAERLREHAPSVLRLALKESTGWSDLFYEHTTSRLTTLRQRVVRERIGPATLGSVHAVRSGVGLRCRTAEHTLYAASTDTSPAGLNALATRLEPAGHSPADDGALEDWNWIERGGPVESSAGMIVWDAADAALSIEPALSEVAVQLHETTRRVLVATSGGLAILEVRTHVTLRVDVTMGRTRAYAIDGGAGGRADLLYCNPERVAAEAVARARTLTDARTLPQRQMPVVIAGGWGGVWLHEAVGHLLEADVLATRSQEPLPALPGQRIAASGVTLVDHAASPGGRGSYVYDDEATPGEETVLVEDGVLRGILTDRHHAAKHGLQPTGNGRRQDYRFPPMPRMTNLILQPGGAAPEELIADVGDGLFVAMVGGGHVIPEEDRFTFDVVEGYRIESGRLTSPVAGVCLSGRASTVLERMAGIGNDLTFDHARGVCVKHGQAVPVSTGMPTVLLSALDVYPAQ